MNKLLSLLHDLIGHAVPQGNAQGELHGLAEEIVADLAGHIAAAVEQAVSDRLGPVAVPPVTSAAPAAPADGAAES